MITGARHKAKEWGLHPDGNDHFRLVWHGRLKRRGELPGTLRAGHGDYVINAERLPICGRRFISQSGQCGCWPNAERNKPVCRSAAWQTHLGRLGNSARCKGRATDPTPIATEGALWSKRQMAHGPALQTQDSSATMPAASIVGPARIMLGPRERPFHKLNTFTPQHRPRPGQATT